MPTVQYIKKQLNLVFDDNLHTKIWHNILDWVIIALILISSLEVFLSTFRGLTENYGWLLRFIDVFTSIVFSIEVSLRIWAADELDPKYKGFRGRLRYCFSFYGLIDILSTYPAFIGLLTSAPVAVLKILRVMRLIRIFRYMKAFRILGRAVASKKQEMGISFAFLGIITVILSFLLYYAEHEAQPELCENAWSTLIWAFAKYLGDPGKIADFPLVTPWGNMIAAFIGILGIAIFAVPAGLIGSGFIEAIEEDLAKQKVESDIERLNRAFRWQKDNNNTGYFLIPPYVPMPNLLTKQYLQEGEVIEAVKNSDEFHLYNIAKAYHAEDTVTDRIVVVACPNNTPYGCCVDRNSKVTIVSTSGSSEPLTSWVAYHLAKIGGFNYVGREIDLNADNSQSYYNIEPGCTDANIDSFIADIDRLSSREGAIVIPMAFCSGPKSRHEKIHLCYNSVHNPGFEGDVCTIKAKDDFDRFAEEFGIVMERDYELPVDRNGFYGVTKKNLLHHIGCRNGFALRMESYPIYFAADRVLKIRAMAELINKYFEPGVDKPVPPELLTRPQKCCGYRDYVD